MKQKVSQLILAASLVLGLTACGGGDLAVSDQSDTKDIAAEAIESEVVENAAEKAVTGPMVQPGQLSIIDPQYGRLWGNALIIDTLYNIQVRGSSQVSFRFRAPVSGRVTEWKGYWPAGSGYAGGTGGTTRLAIVPDNGSSLHAPAAGPILASGQYRPRLSGGKHRESKLFDPVSLSSTQDLVKGKIYHLVFTNPDRSNFISVNTAASDYRNGRPGRWLSPTDWGVLISSSGSWRDVTVNRSGDYYRVPIMQLKMANGAIFGNSDMEISEDSYAFFQRASAPVRERFTPRTSKTITGISFSTAARVGGRLKWELKAGNTVMGSGIVNDGGSFVPASGRAGVFRWFDVQLSAQAQLQAGQTYDLVFTPQGSSEWVFAVERNGADYGFQWPAAFTESQAEHFTGGRWLGAYIWNHKQAGRASNWRVVLHQAQP